MFQMQDLSLFTGWLQLLLISIQSHKQIYSCIDFFPSRKVLVSYENHFSSLGILNKVTNRSLQYLGTNKNFELLIIKKVKDASIPNVAAIAKSHKDNFLENFIFISHYLGAKY